jgi:hypothetical protein
MTHGFTYAAAFFVLAFMRWLGLDLTPGFLIALGLIAVGAGITQEWRRS